MVGVHIKTILDFREHCTYITKDIRKPATTLTKIKLISTYKTLVVEQLLKFKYHDATRLEVSNDRPLTTILGILIKSMRQAIGILPNFPTRAQ